MTRGTRTHHEPLADRLAARTDRSAGPDGCWPWLGILNNKGYGRIYDRGRQELAHRAAYRDAVGPISGGLNVLHRCGNPPCVNPRHFFLGTKADNSRDMVAKGRHGSHVVLNPALVAQIRDLAAQGLRPTAIGRRLAVSRYAVADVVRGRTWRSIQAA